MGETNGDLVCTSDGCFAPAPSSDGGVDAAPPGSCEAISTEYANAIFKARECDAAQPNQCAVQVRAGFFCNCTTWANGDAATLMEIISRYIGAGCEMRCNGSCGALQFTNCAADATSSTGARCLPANVVSLTGSDNNRSLSVPVGEEIDITLQTIGPNGYGTQVDVSSSALTVLEVTIAAGPVNPGGPIRLYRLRAIAPGTATVTIPYVVADMSAGASPPFTLTITVTGGPAAP